MDTKLDTVVRPLTDTDRETHTADIHSSNMRPDDIQPVNTQSTDKGSELHVPIASIVSEEFKVTGDSLVSKFKEWIHQGNIRRVIIKNEEGHTLVELPLTASVLGTAISATVSPELVAVGVIGTMLAHLTVIIEH